MAKILVHITHGPEHPTRAVLGFHVALGHGIQELGMFVFDVHMVLIGRLARKRYAEFVP